MRSLIFKSSMKKNPLRGRIHGELGRGGGVEDHP